MHVASRRRRARRVDAANEAANQSINTHPTRRVQSTPPFSHTTYGEFSVLGWHAVDRHAFVGKRDDSAWLGDRL